MKGLRSDGDPGQRASLLCRALLSRASGRCPVGNDLIVLSHVRLSCDPMDCSPPGSSVHGVSQARILEWVAIFLFQVGNELDAVSSEKPGQRDGAGNRGREGASRGDPPGA